MKSIWDHLMSSFPSVKCMWHALLLLLRISFSFKVLLRMCVHIDERRSLLYSAHSTTKRSTIQIWCVEENPEWYHFEDFVSVWAELSQSVKVLNPFPKIWIWGESPQCFASVKIYPKSYPEYWSLLRHSADVVNSHTSRDSLFYVQREVLEGTSVAGWTPWLSSWSLDFPRSRGCQIENQPNQV